MGGGSKMATQAFPSSPGGGIVLSHIWLCTWSLWISLYMKKIFFSIFISVRYQVKIWQHRTLIILFLFNSKIQRNFWHGPELVTRGEVVLLIFMALAWLGAETTGQPSNQPSKPSSRPWNPENPTLGGKLLSMQSIYSREQRFLQLGSLCAAIILALLLSLCCCCPCVIVVPVLLLSLCCCCLRTAVVPVLLLWLHNSCPCAVVDYVLLLIMCCCCLSLAALVSVLMLSLCCCCLCVPVLLLSLYCCCDYISCPCAGVDHVLMLSLSCCSCLCSAVVRVLLLSLHCCCPFAAVVHVLLLSSLLHWLIMSLYCCCPVPLLSMCCWCLSLAALVSVLLLSDCCCCSYSSVNLGSWYVAAPATPPTLERTKIHQTRCILGNDL